MVDVLQIPFEYYPDPSGGTEVYVAALCRELSTHGLASAVAAPAAADAGYAWETVPVYRYAIPAGLVGATAPTTLAGLKASFATMLDRVRPRLVHFHALSPGIDRHCADAVVERGVPLLLTYHTPTLSCPRGTMMAFGAEPCDGRHRPLRCTACVGQKLTGHALPGAALAGVPAAVSRWARQRLSGRAGTALGLKAEVLRQQAQFRAVASSAARVIAVCDWVRSALLQQGLPAERIVLSRQGLPQREQPAVLPLRGEGPLRLCFFGRLDPTKGVELLFDTLAAAPALSLSLDLYGVCSSPDYRDRLAARAAQDPRVRLLSPVPSAAVVGTMQEYDAVVVPSQWLETGPLVVLEAFAAGRPVIGSRLGGIAELVRDGVDGWLLPPREPAAWARLLVELATDRGLLLARAAAIRPPRSMADAAADMASLYRSVWAETASGA